MRSPVRRSSTASAYHAWPGWQLVDRGRLWAERHTDADLCHATAPRRALRLARWATSHHIGIGRPLNGTPVVLLVDGYDLRVIHATTGEIIRTLTIN